MWSLVEIPFISTSSMDAPNFIYRYEQIVHLSPCLLFSKLQKISIYLQMSFISSYQLFPPKALNEQNCKKKLICKILTTA